MDTEIQPLLSALMAITPEVQTAVALGLSGALIGKTVGTRLFGRNGGDVLAVVFAAAGVYTAVSRTQSARVQ